MRTDSAARSSPQSSRPIVVPRAMSKVVVTGAFSYTGRYLTHLLLERGHTVVYSPLRLWTPALWRDAKFESNQSTPFAVRCKVYLYIR